MNSTHGNFWTGFSLGSILALVTLYAFGTKKGRGHLQKIIGMAENWEDHLVTITKEIEKITSNKKQVNFNDNSSFVGHLLDKIKSKSNSNSKLA